MGEPKAFRFIRGAEVVWTRLGLGVEVSLGYWWPREWSLHVHIGPLLMWVGTEERYDD